MYKGIIFGFSHGSGIVSRIIKFITRGKCSHNWISYWSDTFQRRMIVHADWPGVIIQPFDIWKKENTIIKTFKISNDFTVNNTEESLSWLLDQVGKNYDFTSMCLAGLAMWIRRFIKGKFSSPNKLMCSELILRFCSKLVLIEKYTNIEVTIDELSQFDPELSNPNLILPIFENSIKFEEVNV